MFTYEVTIEETLSKTVKIEAKDEEEAESIAKDMYYDEKIILYPEDCYQRLMQVNCKEDNYSSDWMEM